MFKLAEEPKNTGSVFHALKMDEAGMLMDCVERMPIY
jgi:hypothetical protein